MVLTPETIGSAGLRTGRDVRLACRSGAWRRATSGLAPGFTQANLVVLPADLADGFLRFCQRNPKPCPLLGVSEPGSPFLPELGEDLDLRTDLPGFRVWQDGVLVDEPLTLERWWRDDLVAFAIGCSYSFETALLAEGISLRHVQQCSEVPMYRTNVDCAPAGAFQGKLVVSMRPLRPADAIRAVQITSRFPAVHGAPVHIGLPESIGIKDLSRPDYGLPVEVRDDELPVFWACGVTPQSMIASMKPPFAITHIPGRMLVSDVPDHRYAVM
jgi:uncharacterized protein YcsI (UPF0317 family)